MAILTELTDVRRVLETSRVIVVLGASPTAGRAAHYVPAYLASQGYRIIPVNPVHAGKTLFGERVRAGLEEVGEAVDTAAVRPSQVTSTRSWPCNRAPTSSGSSWVSATTPPPRL